MHNLAIALKINGHDVSGSDDEIFEPSYSRLAKHGLLPLSVGWSSDNINEGMDLVILGMHARSDNPELQAAKQMGLQIMSYPEYIYNSSLNKKRVVIAGSHGKTSTTSMVLHVLKELKVKFDFMVGAQISGFETMVSLSDAPLIVLEGDEYFSSPIDMKAKFLWYKPHVALITGIAWDHINVYPDIKSYHKAFESFISSIEKGGSLIYFNGDQALKDQVEKSRNEIKSIPYTEAEHILRDGSTYLTFGQEEIEISIFGKHNLQNLQGARLICTELGIAAVDFNRAIKTFEGASNRLELVRSSEKLTVYKDFAHSPSKLKATVLACKEQFPKKKLMALMELHTFSSLNKEFLAEYGGCMDAADTALVYYSPETVKHKKLDAINPSEIKSAFKRKDLIVVDQTSDLLEEIRTRLPEHQLFLVMSSGNFGGLKMEDILATNSF